MTSTDLVVGLFGDATYRNQHVTLESGDALVLFTDGVTEAENEQEQQLGIEPVSVLLTAMHRQVPDAMLQAIEDSVETFCSGASAADDLTLLALTRL